MRNLQLGLVKAVPSNDGSVLAADFGSMGVLPSTFTFTRASDGSYWDVDGVLQTASSNVERIDHPPGGRPGLLLEGQRTNSFARSTTISHGAWTKNAVTTPSNSGESPAETTSYFVTEDGTTASHSISQSVTTTAVEWTLSAFVRRPASSSRDFVYLSLTDFESSEINVWFDLTDGTIGTIGGGVARSIEECANGWYRVTLTVECIAGANAARVGISSADNQVSYAGDDASRVEVWGAQLEAGSFATSFITTTVSPVVREADSVTITGSNFTDFYSASSGTFLVECGMLGGSAADSTTRSILVVSDGTDSERHDLTSVAGANPRLLTVDSTTQADITSASAVAAGAKSKLAVGFAANDVTVAKDGTAETPDGTASMPAPATLYLGRSHTASQELFGHVHSLRFWAARRTDSEMQGLTS